MSQFIAIIMVIMVWAMPSEAKNKYKQTMKRQKLKSAQELQDKGPISEEDALLYPLSGVESSYGTDLDHKTMKTGIHAGTAAQGPLGMMPLTFKDVANRVRLRKEELGLAPDFEGDPEIEQWARHPNIDEVAFAMREFPDMTQRAARYLERHLEHRFPGDENLAKRAFMWNQGHAMKDSKIPSDATIEKHDYTKKFRRESARRFKKLEEAARKAKASDPSSSDSIP
jgi:hypothetical protein